MTHNPLGQVRATKCIHVYNSIPFFHTLSRNRQLSIDRQVH
uniref:Uncharacterized protein n=1 Tax=Rhizophora mucronata TaxID=61149 RepID=A0A2P2NX11_RHIMU